MGIYIYIYMLHVRKIQSNGLFQHFQETYSRVLKFFIVLFEVIIFDQNTDLMTTKDFFK